MSYKLTPEQIKAIEDKAAKCDRIELIPHKDGFKIAYIRRYTDKMINNHHPSGG